MEKNGDMICRFGIPLFSIPKTKILVPYPFGTNKKAFAIDVKKIKDYPEDLNQKEEEMSFEDMLKNLELDYQRYERAIRSTLDEKKVFLKRNPDEIFINNYNTKILSILNANMDFQFIFDKYACAAYCVDYINKSNREMSQLLRRSCEEVNNNPEFLPNEVIAKIKSAFLMVLEVSSQEAAWSLLGLSMSETSESEIFILTFPFEERTRLLKHKSKLKQMDKEDTDKFEKKSN